VIYKVSISFHRDFIEIKDGYIKIGIMSKPVKGEANLEIIKKIAKHFGVTKSSVKIVAGKRSREKMVEVYDDLPNPKK